MLLQEEKVNYVKAISQALNVLYPLLTKRQKNN
jgi:hypothetical protein